MRGHTVGAFATAQSNDVGKNWSCPFEVPGNKVLNKFVMLIQNVPDSPTEYKA